MITPIEPPPGSHSPRAGADFAHEHHQAPPLLKLRLMCSYGGHIVPRPLDKSLCYVGGETRIVVVDRQSVSLNSLTSRLSSTLLNGDAFLLKYQLPNEDLDSLISVTTDEDLENMIEEYESTAGSAKVSARLRLFLFPQQSLLDSGVVKGGDDWFFSALNGTHNLTRVFSDSAASSVNCLLGLDDPQVVSHGESSGKEIEGLGGNLGAKKQDVHSVPDSPMMDTTSSFGSTSSSPSMGNLPQIKVHLPEEQKFVDIEEQIPQYTPVIAAKADEGLPPIPSLLVPQIDRVYSDDERSDHSSRSRKPNPQINAHPLKLPTQNHIKSTAIDTASIDSFSSDKMKPIIEPFQFDQLPPQPQFIQPHFGPVQVPAYYPVYPPQQPQYPVYYVSARPVQGDATVLGPQPSFLPAMKQPEIRGAQYMQMPSNQQFVAFSQVPTSVGYEFMDSARGPMFYSPSFPGQFHNVSEADGAKHQQPM